MSKSAYACGTKVAPREMCPKEYPGTKMIDIDSCNAAPLCNKAGGSPGQNGGGGVGAVTADPNGNIGLENPPHPTLIRKHF